MEEKIFEIVNQLNRGAVLIDSLEESSVPVTWSKSLENHSPDKNIHLIKFAPEPPADAGGEMFAMRKKFVKFQGSFWPSQISILRSGSNS